MRTAGRRTRADQVSSNRNYFNRLLERPVVIGILFLQVAVPSVIFFQEPPTRLGWQMYSGLGELPRIEVATADGAVKEVEFSDIAAARRPELNWDKHLPAQVCDVTPNAIAVELIYRDSEQQFGCGSS